MLSARKAHRLYLISNSISTTGNREPNGHSYGGNMYKLKNKKSCLIAAALLLPLSGFQAHAQGLTVAKDYCVSVFAKCVSGKFSAPDSLAVTRDRVYIGYGDANDPAGKDGTSTHIVEYTHSRHQL